MNGIYKAFAVLGLSAAAASAPPALSEDEIAKVKGGSHGRGAPLLPALHGEEHEGPPREGLFPVPLVYLSPQGAQVDATPQEVTARTQANLDRLLASGWDRSEFPSPDVSVLRAGAAIASGKFYRYRKDGSLLSENAVTYVFGKKKAGWRIVAYGGHGFEAVVPCTD